MTDEQAQVLPMRKMDSLWMEFRDGYWVTAPPFTLADYQEEAMKTAVYPDRYGRLGDIYAAMGLAGEVGELLNKMKKVLRGDYGEGGLDKAIVEDELGDVLWYMTALADEYGLSLEDVARRNLMKLKDRQERDVIKGSGDNR